MLVRHYLIPRTLRTIKIFLRLCCLDQAKRPILWFSGCKRLTKKVSGGFTDYSSTSGTGGFKFGSSTGGSEFETFTYIKTEHISGAVTDNTFLSCKGKKGENTVI